jgi:hypothetical protein
MGIALGRNPNGIAYAVRQGLVPLRRRPVLLAGTLAGVAAVVALRLTGALTGAPFALALVGEVAAGALAAQLLEARRSAAPAVDGEATEAVPLEWAGVVRPFTVEEVAGLDRVLGLEPGRRPAGVGVGADT